MDAAKRGAAALEAGKADEAVQAYTTALSQNPQAVNYYIQRSIAYARSKPANHVSALGDAETAVVLAHKRGKSELIAMAQLRRAISLYSLGRFADCQECLNWSEKRNKSEKSIPIWRMKVEDKLKPLSAEDEAAKVTVKEIPEVDVDEKMNALKVSSSSSAGSGAAASDATIGAASAATQPTFTPPSKIRHDWYQSAETVTVSLMAKGVPKDKAAVDIQAGSLSISFPLPTGGSDYDFSLEPLFAPIVPSESSYKIMSTKVEFSLKKATPGQKWHSLEGTEPITTGSESNQDASKAAESDAVRRAVTSQPQPQTTAPSYPTSSRTGPKNWDKVVDDLTKKPKSGGGGSNNNNSKKPTSSTNAATATDTSASAATASNKPSTTNDKDDDNNDDDYDYDDDSGDEVNNFFKKLYKNADPDTRRAMMKSYQESNGTALSTNWNEVQSKTYETLPPDGMEAKKW